MQFCATCQHELGIGRFCTNCGQQIEPASASTTHPALPVTPVTVSGPEPDIDGVASTAERRAARRSAALQPKPPRTPPAAADTPPAPRFPLFADEVGAGSDPQFSDGGTQTDLPALGGPVVGAGRGSLLDRFANTQVDVAPARVPQPVRDSKEREPREHRPREPRPRAGARTVRTSVLAAVVLVLVAVGLLAWLASRDTDSDTARGAAGTAGSTEPGARPLDVTAGAEATTPANAPPATEIGGGTADFVATNMLDGDPGTAWRIAGDASGKEIVFTLAQPTTITRVGLINGYAKMAQEPGGKKFDWYHGNRRITKVAWVLGDDTTIDQDLERDRSMQSIDVDPVRTTTITLRILEVTKPGTGRASRDFTTISDVSITGSAD